MTSAILLAVASDGDNDDGVRARCFLRGVLCEAESVWDGALVPGLVSASRKSSASTAATEMLWSTFSTLY